MRPPITKEEVELLIQDMEMRRQTGKLEAIKRLISHGKE